MSKLKRNALIVEGGAMRSVFSAGLLDGFLERRFNPFDFYIGVSAGALNLAGYLAEMPRESLRIFTEFALYKDFIRYSRFFRGGHLLDLDWLVDHFLAESSLDLEQAYWHGKAFFVCVTDVESGEARYIDTTPANLAMAIKASSALPYLYRGFPEINGRPMTDGGVADGIPVAEAIRLGATRIMVIRSRHRSYLKKDTPGHRLIRWKLGNYPALTAAMRQRVRKYREVLQLIRNPSEGIEIIEVCPPAQFSIGRFNRNRSELLKGYESGFKCSEAAIRRWGSIRN